MKREHLGSEQDIGLAPLKQGITSRPVTAHAVTGYLKEEFVVEQVDASEFELCSAVKEAYDVLERAMNSVFLVHHASVRWMLDAV